VRGFCSIWAVAEPTDAEYPFVLMTVADPRRSGTPTRARGKSDILRRLYPAEAYVEIHPSDAARLGIRPHAKVVVRTRRGSLEVNAFVTPTVRGRAGVPADALRRRESPDGYRPLIRTRRQPSYKHCAAVLEVRVKG
jgi:assimilatory nitrate reductase catalytic subunit